MLIFNDIWEFGFDMDILHQFDQWLWLLVRLWWGPCLSSRHTLNIDFILCCVWILLCTSWMCHASLPGCLCLSSFSLSSCLSVSHLSSITSFNHQQSRSDGKILSICLRGFENVFLFYLERHQDWEKQSLLPLHSVSQFDMLLKFIKCFIIWTLIQ